MQLQPGLQLAVVIMRVSRDDIYREVKQWALTSRKNPVATQLLIRDTARAIANSVDVSLSVITQINCKMGGDLWTLDGALSDTLVIGEQSIDFVRFLPASFGISSLESSFQECPATLECQANRGSERSPRKINSSPNGTHRRSTT